jgi:hypothetical protein
MLNKIKNVNTLRRVKEVQDIVNENYEPGRHDKSMRRIYRTIIVPKIPISERTFERYMVINLEDYKEMLTNLKPRRHEQTIIAKLKESI